MFDGTFDRRDLDNLLALLDPATDAWARLRPWGWRCTFAATLHGLQVEIDILPPWAAGEVGVDLTEEIRRGMRAQLDRITTPQIWLHAEPRSIILRPSID